MYGKFRHLQRQDWLVVGAAWRPRIVVNDLRSRTRRFRRCRLHDGRGRRSRPSFVVARPPSSSSSFPPLVERTPPDARVPTSAAAAVQPRPVVDLLPVYTAAATTTDGARRDPDNDVDGRWDRNVDRRPSHIDRRRHSPSSLSRPSRRLLLTRTTRLLSVNCCTNMQCSSRVRVPRPTAQNQYSKSTGKHSVEVKPATLATLCSSYDCELWPLIERNLDNV